MSAEFPPFATWPFVLRLLFDPVRALDLEDEKGRSDHSKILPAIVLITALVCAVVRNPIPPLTLVILGSLSYGYGAWRTFLKQRSVTGTVAVTDTTIRNITEKIERVVDADGHSVQPTPN